jgi:hypothetical protein
MLIGEEKDFKVLKAPPTFKEMIAEVKRRRTS